MNRNVKPKVKEEQSKDEKDILQQKAHSKRTLDMLHKRVKIHNTQLEGGTIINPDKTETKFYGFKKLLKEKNDKFNKYKDLADKYGMQVDSIELYITALNREIKKYTTDITTEQKRLENMNIIKIGKTVPIIRTDKKVPIPNKEKETTKTPTGNKNAN